MEGSFEHCERSSQFPTMDIQQDTNSVSSTTSSSNSSNFTFQFDLSYIFSEEDSLEMEVKAILSLFSRDAMFKVVMGSKQADYKKPVAAFRISTCKFNMGTLVGSK